MDSDLSADEIIEMLGLEPLGFEGGHYREQHRSELSLAEEALPTRYGASRHAATAIFYMLTPSSLSLMHRLKSDEIYHFYLGDPVEQLLLHPDGRAERLVLGSDLRAGQRVQHVVPRGVWQGSHLLPGGRFALMGTTMSPGFDLRDFELGDRAALIAEHPAQAELLVRLTPARLSTPHFELAAATLDLLHAHLRGPETLAAGLRCTVGELELDPSTARAELLALESDPSRRGWGSWYVIARASRDLVGVARFIGPPDPSGAVELQVGALPDEVFAALEAEARRDPRTANVRAR